MIADAASPQESGLCTSKQTGSPARILSTGICSMMTPVENGRTDSTGADIRFPRASHTLKAFCIPTSPVPALAKPVLTMSALIGFLPFKNFSARTTGAARNWFVVNTPATFTSSSKRMTRRSLRPGLRIPALVAPKVMPFIGAG